MSHPQIGKSFFEHDARYEGLMDEVRTYARALPSDEMKALFEDALGRRDSVHAGSRLLAGAPERLLPRRSSRRHLRESFPGCLVSPWGRRMLLDEEHYCAAAARPVVKDGKLLVEGKIVDHQLAARMSPA